MSRNRNRDQRTRPDRSAAAESGGQQRGTAEQSGRPSGDGAGAERKQRTKKFGHN